MPSDSTGRADRAALLLFTDIDEITFCKRPVALAFTPLCKLGRCPADDVAFETAFAGAGGRPPIGNAGRAFWLCSFCAAFDFGSNFGC